MTDVPACTFTFSNNTVAVKIISGNDRIWTSQECRNLPTVEDLVVRAEKPERVAMRWSGRRSNDGCKLFSAPWAEKGYYHVVAATLGGEPTDQQFRLINPSPKTVTKAPEPEQRDRRRARPVAHRRADQQRAERRHRAGLGGASRPDVLDEPDVAVAELDVHRLVTNCRV